MLRWSTNDWLIGDDLPDEALGRREAIRDMAGQPVQPAAHVDAWVSTCSDEEGVHTNSGITNKAFHNIATQAAAGKDKAERIFYRALTVYLGETSSLEDARAAALQSAQDLYADDTAVYTAVTEGFNAVGLDGQWNPPSNDCTCAAAAVLAGPAVTEQASVLDIAATLYRVRDELLGGSAAGKYYRELYEAHTGRASRLLLLDPALRSTAADILAEFTPGLEQLVDGRGDRVVVSPRRLTI